MNRTMIVNPVGVAAPRAALLAATVAIAALTFLLGSPGYAADAPAKKPAAKAAAAKATEQKAYPSPEELFQALADAAKADDLKNLRALFGPGSDAVLSSGDAVADKQRRER